MAIRKAEGERRSTSFPLEDDRHISRLARKGSLELWGYRNSDLHRRDSLGYGMKAVIPGELEVTSLTLGLGALGNALKGCEENPPPRDLLARFIAGCPNKPNSVYS